jgi:diguanylate cyclase (GGDEF)-like protein
MIQQRRILNRRILVGLVFGLWVILVASATLRACSQGQYWGIHVAVTTEGPVVVTSIDPEGTAWLAGVRLGDQITAIDNLDARWFSGLDVPGSARELTFREDDGPDRTSYAAAISNSIVGLLAGAAVLFVVLGALVYRWSADAVLARWFLLLTGSFATALMAVPAARLGHAWAGYLVAASALLAGPGLFGLFLTFPRPIRVGRHIPTAFLVLAIPLAAIQFAEPGLDRDVVAVLDGACWLWTLINLLGALVVLGLRIRRQSDREALAPLLAGAGFGVAPLVALVAVPRLIGAEAPVAPEVAAISMAAIPISFAYAILRHQMFGLDVLMRRLVLRIGGAAVAVAGFLAGWFVLQRLGLPTTEAALLAAIVVGLAMPTIIEWTRLRLDSMLYRPLYTMRDPSTTVFNQVDGLEALGAAVALRLRQLLPIQWAACVVHDDTTPANSASRRIFGADGQLPLWLDSSSMLDQSPTEVTVSPIHHFDTGAVMLLAGPRLDGGDLDGIQIEALNRLAQAVAPSFEAGLLRERAENETRFRQGLTELAGDLAAAATVDDVLRSFLSHATRLLSADSASLWRRTPDGNVTLFDREMFGTPPGAETVRTFLSRRPANDRDHKWAALTPDGASIAFVLDDGSTEPMLCFVRRVFDPIRFGALEERRARELADHTTGALRRAAERESLEEQLRQRAFYDSLTGLPNRALFLDRLAHATARGERLGEEVAVLFIDLDRFKVVNDSLGHSAGDELLVQVGQRLRACLRESDTIARLGGDEFTVLLEGPTALADAARAAERILDTFRAPFVLDGQDAFGSASIGISGGSDLRDSGRDPLREADIALYRAKASGRGRYTIFEQRMSHLPSEHLHLESDLHRAIERNELRVHYQPIFSLADSHITGLEALVRWEHPEKGLVAPGHFIPLAEDTGLIVPIGKWVLAEACRQMRQWQEQLQSTQQMFVSINLSARQLQDPSLLQDVQEALEGSGLDPQCVQLEITESVVMAEPEATVFKLHALKSLGIKLAVDDFGTGYSSLAYLKRFPIDVLKIDRAFVSGLDSDQGEQDSAIVQTVVSLAQALGLRTTAEGIEERSQWTRLLELGCDSGQGYIFSRPLGAEAIEGLLRGGSGPRPRLAVAA